MNLRDMYFQMLRIRMIEEAIAVAYSKQEMRCPVHLSIGQEAAAVGLCAALKKTDKAVGTHRSHAIYLAKGGSLKGLIGELYGKACGCSRGNGGSMHLIDLDCGFVASTSIVAGTIPVGVGLSFADRQRREDHWTAVCFGDAAIEEGVFHEAANFAALHKLNVIFFCENNLYSCYTRIEKRQPERPLRYIARAHNLHYYLTEPNDVQDVMFNVLKAKEQIGPSFIEVPTYRYLEHCGPNDDSNLGYRGEPEVNYWKKLDPLKVAGIKDDAEMQLKIQNEIMDVFEFVQNAPPPDPSEIGRYVYANS